MNSIIDIGLVPNYSNSDNPEYDMASDKYIKKFGYEPHYVAMPQFSIEQILNAVETGVELEVDEPEQGEYVI
jgi:hypothetical protein